MTEMQVWLKQYTGVFWLKHNSFPGGASLFSVGAGGEVGGGWVWGWFLVKGRSLFSSGRRGKEEVPHGEYHFWWEWGFKEYPRVGGGDMENHECDVCFTWHCYILRDSSLG